MGNSAAEIRDTAGRVWARTGFAGASLQTIADEVGVTKQALLYHFTSKEELREAVLEDIFAHWRERLPRLLKAATHASRFGLLFDELVDFFLVDPNRARLILREILDRPSEMNRMIIANLRPWLLLVGQYIREAQEGGNLEDDIQPESYLLHVVTLTVTTIANLDVLTSALGSDDAGRERIQQTHIAELRRLARTALIGRPDAGSASGTE